MARATWAVRLPLFLALIVASFLASTAVSQWQVRAIDDAALAIADNAAPSIEHLAEARSGLRQLQLVVREYLDAKKAGASPSPAEVDAARAKVDRALAAYLLLPPFPGEQQLWADILAAKGALDEVVARCMAEIAHAEFATAEQTWRVGIGDAANALNVAVTRDIEFNATHSRDLALDIRTLRGRSTLFAFTLDVVCVLIAIAAAVALRRAFRAHAELTDRHNQLLEARARELEAFAGRVAHDILSPLGTVSLSLQASARADDEASRTRFVARGNAALERVKRLVRGLLAFARAGAKPSGDASAGVASTIADIVEELKPLAQEERIELAVSVQTTALAACDPGVLTSLVSNLARNALKYMGDADERRVSIRAIERGEMIRVEVEDTGPGIPLGLEADIFEPYVRAAPSSASGLGLGLATVKRLAEAHGGRAGVESVPGRGATFWFELPCAPAEAPASSMIRAASGSA